MSKHQLPEKLNLPDAILLVVGAVIGSGIFLTSGLMARDLPSAEGLMLVWLLGGVLSLFGGLTLAELGAMMPEAGGQYIYLREAYGDLTGFLYGWTAFLVIQTGGIAALAVGFAEYLSYFIPVLGLDQLLIQTRLLSISSGQLLAAAAIVLLSAINYFGIRSGSTFQNIFTALKIAAIVLLVVAGLFAPAPEVHISGGEIPAMPGGFDLILAIGIGLVAVLWTFDGWYAVNTVASEIKNARRNLPLSLIIGLVSIIIIYLLVNYFYLKTLPMYLMAGEVRIGETAVSFLFGAGAGAFMTALILISIFGCLSATIIYGPRIYYAMAEDGLFFRSLAKVHPRYRSPANAVVWQGIWAALLCLTGTYEALYTYVVFAVMLFYVANAAAVFVLRRKKPQAQRPYRVWGYPVVPVLFALSMTAIMITTLIEKPVESITGLLLIAAGLPAYYYWKKSAGISD